jgi:uncharacterized protein YmfQ (DUF2313 family)
MARTAAELLAELLAISPPGEAFPQDGNSPWAVWLGPLADAISSLEQRQDSLLTQVVPAQAIDLLADFERVLGPDPLGRDQGNLDIGQRQALAAQRWGGTGGGSANFYVALAALVGATISIATFTSSQTGATVCGDALAPQADELTWQVTLPASLVFTPVCGAAECGDPLGALPSDKLAGTITLYISQTGCRATRALP